MYKIRAIPIIGILIFLFCMPGSVWAQNESGLSNKEKVLLNKANRALQDGESQKARRMIRSYLQEDPGDISGRIFLFLGYIWYQEGKPARARRVYERGLEHARNNFELHRNFAVACYQTAKYQSAGEHFEKSYGIQNKTTKNPETELLYRAASAFYQSQAYRKGKRVLRKLLSGTKEAEKKWLRLLAQIHFNLKEWCSAEKVVRKILEQKPLNRDYWKMLARCDIQQSDYSNAATCLEIAYCIQAPEDPSKWERLSNLYMYLNAPVKAAQSLKRSFSGNVTAQEYARLSDMYYRAFRYHKALKYIDKALKQEATSKRYLKKGNYLYKNRDFAKAIDAFQMSSKLGPDSGKAHLLKGFVACEMDRWELAKKSFQKAGKFENYKSSARSGLGFVTDILKAKEIVEREKSLVAARNTN